MSRIIAGQNKGRRLKAPAGGETRPTGARVRQSLFDILAPRIDGARFLDAFAGSGAVGFEALSRGASRVVFVERSAPAVLALRHNAALVAEGGGDVQIFRQDTLTALAALAERGHSFDIVYVDPPYDSELYEPTLERVAASSLLAPGGLVVAEHFHKRRLPERIGRLRSSRDVRVGDHRLTFYEAS